MRTVLVTGSSRGIGLALCRQLHQNGWQVIATCRKPDMIEAEPFYMKLPLSVDDDESIAKLAQTIQDHPIDLLINNAGIYQKGSQNNLETLNRQQMIDEFNVDAVSQLMVSQALLPNLKSTRGIVVNISSLMGSIGDCASARSYSYRMAKAALNMATKVCALEMKGALKAVVAIHPGYVATDMTKGGGPGAITVEEAAAAICNTIDNLDPSKVNGCLLSRLGKIDPW